MVAHFPHLLDPRVYPDHGRRCVRVPTWDTFEHVTYPKFNVHAGDAREFRVISCDSCRSTKDPALESAQLAKVVPYSFETPLSAPLRTITLSLRFSVPTLED